MRISYWSSDVCSSDLRQVEMHCSRGHCGNYQPSFPRTREPSDLASARSERRQRSFVPGSAIAGQPFADPSPQSPVPSPHSLVPPTHITLPPPSPPSPSRSPPPCMLNLHIHSIAHGSMLPTWRVAARRRLLLLCSFISRGCRFAVSLCFSSSRF